TPIHIIDEGALRRNMEILSRVQRESGAKIIHALKAFAQHSVFPVMREYLPGATASSLHEARLAREEFGGEVHVCAPAYVAEEFSDLLELADHLVFNSASQWETFRERTLASKQTIECGLRINPQHSEVKTRLYDPCAPGSRLGVTAEHMTEKLMRGLSGIHFHTLCEMGLEPLVRTLEVVEKKFNKWFDRIQWINFGGGHHITRPDYDTDGLIELIRAFRQKYGLTVYMEPGEASVIRTGVLVARVLDVIPGSPPIAMLDVSATAHMPDTLEMPYRPDILDASEPEERSYTYALGGPTCLAGDAIGHYSFDNRLEVGSLLFFLDMSHYTMVKNTQFNGVRLPSIAIADTKTGRLEVVREFGYEDFRARLS
ncbi:MAG: carboxynorspermidine decarboxylase, partial [Spirochaetales bacterium]|nr:carboxynorspermidine decarboxylase [Spirochaetales bacterium]